MPLTALTTPARVRNSTWRSSTSRTGLAGSRRPVRRTRRWNRCWCHERCLGSRASRRASPSMMNAITVRVRTMLGKSTRCGAVRSSDCPVSICSPQEMAGRCRPDAQVGQRRLRGDEHADGDGGEHEHGRDGVRQDVPGQDAQVGRAHRAGRRDVVRALHRDDLRADQPHRRHPAEERQRDGHRARPPVAEDRQPGGGPTCSRTMAPRISGIAKKMSVSRASRLSATPP